MEGQSQLSCFSRLLNLFKVHISEGGVGEISVSVGETGTRRVHLVLDLKETPCRSTSKPARNLSTRRPEDSLLRRRKLPSRKKRDRERKEAWIKKKDSRKIESVDAPDAVPGEASLMSPGEQQQQSSMTSCTPHYTPGETSLKLPGEQQSSPGEVSCASAQTGALEDYLGCEGDQSTTSSFVIESGGDDEDPTSAPDQRPGENIRTDFGQADLKEMFGNGMPYWYSSDNCVLVDLSNVLDERTGVKCRLHPDSYKIITLRRQKFYSCIKCQGETQFQRLSDFNYAVHRDIKFTNTNIMSIINEKMQ